jgi:hypothetical protein
MGELREEASHLLLYIRDPYAFGKHTSFFLLLSYLEWGSDSGASYEERTLSL